MTDEFISKQDAINIANDWLLDCFKAQKQDRSCGLIRRLDDSPSADVASVVRCKDCKSRRIDGYCTKFQNNISGIAVSWFMPEDDGFCSYGKRKGE